MGGRPPCVASEGGRDISGSTIPGIRDIESYDDRLDLVVGSGRYSFVLERV